MKNIIVNKKKLRKKMIDLDIKTINELAVNPIHLYIDEI